ncbi:TIR domain-containing protein [Clavibacter michiganensis]|uniref:TIR domain-containing protein n=1 Tax=Clavibacter michiganensis TaxID=28447 RepID=UPI001D0B42A9|nr:nucleotide-binding protein [Clavibacter michiganensis]MDO4029622.1 nucleotide-binding protein [Clavibacter michiganensis]MDO4125230.1 nucleotide-binding protein [Clavibacter michiganensis]MDO4140502.1 nucleotide-binding protein [Clavibacter michiganensis]UDM12135.1 nucleotide-binding protein [Clavibacter michiganensis subsp. michiganensis]UDM15246.1 nucleotide-binding protein [Clavibacter michiganensis subsp. michiganensis]
MELFADSMPDLPQWIASSAPPRTKRLFKEYLEARDASEIPAAWRGDDADGEPVDATSEVPAWARKTPPLIFPEFTDSEIGFVSGEIESNAARSLFIVHGHDEAALNSIRIYVHKLTGIMPVSLAEEAGRGQTIIEKFEAVGDDASYVIVLLTPDDVGQTLGSHQAGIKPDPRARQNVVLELGYFIGKLGRRNVVVVDADVERPSDLAGLSYVQYPGSNWKDALRTELQAASL